MLFIIAVNQYKIKQGQWFNQNSGIWCIRQFYCLTAALPGPATVGCSGTLVRNSSKAVLKTSTLTEFMFLMLDGKRLNILAPFTLLPSSHLHRMTGLHHEEEQFFHGAHVHQ